MDLWSDDIAVADHATVGLARLIWQYRGDHPRLQAALQAQLDEDDRLEAVLYDVLVGLWPLTAVGTQLDLLGEIVGQERGDLTDDEYRIVILCRILANRSDGRTEDLLGIIDVAGATGTTQVDESWPCGLVVSVAGTDYGWVLGDIVADATGGGIALHWSWTSHDDADVFAMGDTLGADETNASGGFGDLTGATQTTGGYFTGGARL
jgi:hypothetical protein